MGQEGAGGGGLGALSEPPRRSALVLGATGLVGSACVDTLLADPRYHRVRVLLRRPHPRRHPRLEAHPVDFERLAEHRPLFRVDDLFCCLGTTLARAGSREAFRRVDHDYVLHAARLALAEGARRFLVVSALGADARSRLFYNRVKGEMEEAIRRLPFEAAWILRPSLLLGDRPEPRPAERVAAALFRPLSPLMAGPLRRFRPVEARAVAEAMVRLAWSDGKGGVVESDRIADLTR